MKKILILCAFVLIGCNNKKIDDEKLNKEASVLASNVNIILEDARAFYKIYNNFPDDCGIFSFIGKKISNGGDLVCEILPKDSTTPCINIKFANKKADELAYIEILKTNEDKEICKELLNNKFFKEYSYFEFKKYSESKFFTFGKRWQ